MNSSFFEAMNNIKTVPVEYVNRLFYDDKGRLVGTDTITIDQKDNTIEWQILYGEVSFITITSEEKDMCQSKLQDYTIIDEKLVFSPPANRTWNLEQNELTRNPYVKS